MNATAASVLDLVVPYVSDLVTQLAFQRGIWRVGSGDHIARFQVSLAANAPIHLRQVSLAANAPISSSL